MTRNYQREKSDEYRRIARCLTDPSRKSPRGPYRYAYTEEQFDRRLDDEAALPFQEEIFPADPVMKSRLLEGQLRDLLDALSLSRRQTDILQRRMEGETAAEIAVAAGISERRVWGILKEIKQIFQVLREKEGSLESTSSPYYGWQEVFLQEQRRGR